MKIEASTIRLDGDPVLRMKAEEVPLPLAKQDAKLLNDLLSYVRHTHDEKYCEAHHLRASVGIAAPQVGISKKLLAVSIVGEQPQDTVELALANPIIISNSVQKAYLADGESCLSVVPDVKGIVPRYARITVRAYDLTAGRIVDIRLTDYPAIVMQHEIDHLYGLLYYDRIDKKNPDAPIPGAIVLG